MTERKWKMPDWMKPYARLIGNTGHDPTIENIEKIFNGYTDPTINLPLSLLQACVKSQVELLVELYIAKELKRYG